MSDEEMVYAVMFPPGSQPEGNLVFRDRENAERHSDRIDANTYVAPLMIYETSPFYELRKQRSEDHD